ncbi:MULTISPECIES: hypothetical protein [Dyella]|uniref:Rap1a immunity protein domain-containing protein n=2 Tax=Dyella TaxID=231454 RepID=A0A4R0YS78_9GAMM|nr:MULTISPECIES: hypothetical protein [Dyella]TBR37014.1 hypothetical protein EYV96_14055 [Dyella terrae]TCI07897.1 hypothetical protein EZM97_24815 [Dyella soli]
MSNRWRRSLQLVVVALLMGASGGFGYYEGIGKGAAIAGYLDSQNRVANAISDVHYSTEALQKNDPGRLKTQVSINLRLALWSLAAESPNGTAPACTDKERESLSEAAHYIAAHPDPKLFGDPPIARGLLYCSSHRG